MVHILIKQTVIFSMIIMINGCTTTPYHKLFRKEDIKVNVSVVDDQNRPILAANVWRVASPVPVRRDYSEENKVPLSPEYLERSLRRYGQIAEFANKSRLRHKALEERVSSFETLVPTNVQGLTEEIIKYDKGRDFTATLTYAATSYCYQPNTVEQRVKADERQLQLKFVLKRDLSCVLPSASYWTKYQEKQWKFSERNWKEGDAEPARDELLAAAKAAEAVGDVQIAARILSWIPYLPTAIYFKKNVGSLAMSGYNREDEDSARNMEILEEANKLDPNNRYIKMKLLLLRPPSDRRERIDALEKMISGGDFALWPEAYTYLEDAYYANGQKDKAYQILLDFNSFEPEHFQNQTHFKKIRRARYLSSDEFAREYIVGNDVNKLDEYRNEPIYYAIRSGNVVALDWLVANGVPLPRYSLFQAVVSRRPEMVERVFQIGMEWINADSLRSEIRRVDGMLVRLYEDKMDLLEIRKILENKMTGL